MGPSCLDHVLTPEESLQFERDGYFVVENAIPLSLVDTLVSAVDRVDREERARMGKDAGARINHYDFIGKDDSFLPLLDWPTTFPKVWGILGWHIQLYHTHMTVSPPEPVARTLEEQPGWQ